MRIHHRVMAATAAVALALGTALTGASTATAKNVDNAENAVQTNLIPNALTDYTDDGGPNWRSDFNWVDPNSGNAQTDTNMWAAGTQTVSNNAHAVHSLWHDWDNPVPMLITNGYDTNAAEGTNVKLAQQMVWERDNVAPNTCTSDKYTIGFTLTMTAMSVYTATGQDAAEIWVEVNDKPIGEAQTLNQPEGTPVSFSGTVEGAASFKIDVYSNGSAYTGNDFAIWDLKLVESRQCQPASCDDPDLAPSWLNYTSNADNPPVVSGNANWHPVPAQPKGVKHVNALNDLPLYTPYQVGNGAGSWFMWAKVVNGVICENNA